ncbi:MAG TPA: hypothetical protein PKK61_14560 [Defluviitaleaceae bacterium]|nr:hypothetical protein [Defluviitaleaceae bacterium]
MNEENKNFCQRDHKTTPELLYAWFSKNRFSAFLVLLIVAFYITIKALGENVPLSNLILSFFKWIM